MASSQTDKNEKMDKTGAPDDVAEIKHKLALRMVFAGAMIVALLGGLALFDYYSAQPEPEVAAPPQFTEPVPVAKKMVTQPVTPPASAPEGVAPSEAKTAEPEATSAPADKHAPRVDAPPPPEVAAQPNVPRKPAATAHAASPAAAPVPSAPPRVAEPKSPSMPATPSVGERTVSSASAPSAATEPIPAPPRLFSGYAVQAGVFADPRRAEELQARLVQEGVPATIEARVQVGPFKTRAEAEAARAKLRALGVESVLLPPKGAKR
ncbi:MAG: SPOR domain-containing protein [Propionivibrio sp.]